VIPAGVSIGIIWRPSLWPTRAEEPGEIYSSPSVADQTDMDALELFRTRRTHRSFLDQPLTEEQIKALENIVLWAPTAMNKRATHFVFVTRKETRQDLASRLPNGRFIANAPLAVVIMASADSFAPQDDCAIAATHLQLAVHALGLGSCWTHVSHMTGVDGHSSAENIAAVVPVPEGSTIECIVAIGHPDPSEQGVPCGERQWDHSRVIEIS